MGTLGAQSVIGNLKTFGQESKGRCWRWGDGNWARQYSQTSTQSGCSGNYDEKISGGWEIFYLLDRLSIPLFHINI
jgi:hypothetical protein